MKGEKERARRKKGGEEKKAMVALLLFIMATLEIVFDPKKLLDARDPFYSNVSFIYFSQCNTCFFFLTIFFFVRRSTVEKHVEQAGEDEAGSCHPLDLKKLELDLVRLQEITK